jgi:hypothetical protein
VTLTDFEQRCEIVDRNQHVAKVFQGRLVASRNRPVMPALERHEKV